MAVGSSRGGAVAMNIIFLSRSQPRALPHNCCRWGQVGGTTQSAGCRGFEDEVSGSLSQELALHRDYEAKPQPRKILKNVGDFCARKRTCFVRMRLYQCASKKHLKDGISDKSRGKAGRHKILVQHGLAEKDFLTTLLPAGSTGCCPGGETDIMPRFERGVPGSTPGRGTAWPVISSRAQAPSARHQRSHSHRRRPSGSSSGPRCRR
jgi:hypothetical protein